MLNDATIILRAVERGWTFVTRNIRDSEFMNGIVSPGQGFYYRAV